MWVNSIGSQNGRYYAPAAATEFVVQLTHPALLCAQLEATIYRQNVLQQCTDTDGSKYICVVREI